VRTRDRAQQAKPYHHMQGIRHLGLDVPDFDITVGKWGYLSRS
jgi:hypothetical protein